MKERKCLMMKRHGVGANPFRDVTPKAKTIVVSQSILLVLLLQYGLKEADKHKNMETGYLACLCPAHPHGHRPSH